MAKWTPEEDAVLRALWPRTASWKVAQELPGRTESGCKARADRLGLAKDPAHIEASRDKFKRSIWLPGQRKAQR